MSTYDVNLSRRSVHVSGMTHRSVLGVTSDTEASVLSIPLGLSREKNWRETLFLCLVQTTHGLICASRIHGLGGFHPVPWYNSNCTKERSSRTIQVPGTGWNPPSLGPLKAQISPCVDESTALTAEKFCSVLKYFLKTTDSTKVHHFNNDTFDKPTLSTQINFNLYQA